MVSNAADVLKDHIREALIFRASLMFIRHPQRKSFLRFFGAFPLTNWHSCAMI